MADEVIECGLDSPAGMADEDRTLVAAACDDTDAAGRLYDRHYDAIRDYIYHSTFDRAVTDDLTSNVFLAAFRHLRRFAWQRIPFRAWLYRIASNEVRMHYRRQKRAAAARRRYNGTGSEAAPPASDRPAAGEELRMLYEALRLLKAKYRTVIVLRYFEDKAIAEISTITGRRPGTVKSQLHRGLAQLQDILIRRGVLPS